MTWSLNSWGPRCSTHPTVYLEDPCVGFPGHLSEGRQASRLQQLCFHLGPDGVHMLRIDRFRAVLGGQKVSGKADLSQVLSVELTVMLSEMSTNHQTSGGVLRSAFRFRISAALGRCQCVLKVLSLQKFDYGIISIYCVSDIFTYLEYVCTKIVSL